MTSPSKAVPIGSLMIGGGHPLVFLAGPCVIESRDLIFRVAESLKATAMRLEVGLIFKSSYTKANRTSGKSFMGPGLDEGLRILADVKKEFDLPIVTDIHSESEAAAVAEVADVLQIPAFLCRQTELLHAAGRTGRVVNIKKGQFLAPDDMKHAAQKVEETGNLRVLLTERGTTFGYHNLVVDMRGLEIMRRGGYPVILDATHAVQLPGGDTVAAQTAGQPEFIAPLARAGVAAGVDGLFLEVHPDPPHALSDAASQLPLSRFESLAGQVLAISRLVHSFE